MCHPNLEISHKQFADIRSFVRPSRCPFVSPVHAGSWLGAQEHPDARDKPLTFRDPLSSDLQECSSVVHMRPLVKSVNCRPSGRRRGPFRHHHEREHSRRRALDRAPRGQGGRRRSPAKAGHDVAARREPRRRLWPADRGRETTPCTRAHRPGWLLSPRIPRQT